MNCTKPDRDVPKMKCGYPLPCPFHTVIIDASKEAVTVTIPIGAPIVAVENRGRLLKIGAAAKQTQVRKQK